MEFENRTGLRQLRNDAAERRETMRKRETWKRVLAALLCALLMVTLPGVSVWAESKETITNNKKSLCDDMNGETIVEEEKGMGIEKEYLAGSTASQAISLDEAKWYVSQISSPDVRNCFYELFDEFPPYQGGGTKINNATSGTYWQNKINENIWSGTQSGGAYQCFGFALYCYAKLFHCLGSDRNQNDSAMLLEGAQSVSYDSFRNAGVKPGAHIRAVKEANSGHSMVVLYYDADYIVIYHANGDNNGTVYAGKYTWSQFNSAQLAGHSGSPRYIKYVAMPYDYPYDYDKQPNEAYIYSDKDSYAIGEEAVFSFGASNASGLYIPIDINGTRADWIDVSGTNSYRLKLNTTGVYGFFLVARSGSGEATSEYKEIRVYDKVPEGISISTDKESYNVGEEVVFQFSCKNADGVAIPIDVNGKREYFNWVTGKTSYSQIFNEPGLYGYFLYGKNGFGEASSEYKTFYVYNEPPKDLSISTNKSAYLVGEDVIFNFSFANFMNNIIRQIFNPII